MDAAGADHLTAAAVAGRLRERGHRVTRQRLAVYEALAAAGGHRGAEDLAERLRAHGDPMPVTSVYNALDALQSAGLVSVAHRGPPRALYELAGRAHHHFLCRGCGRLSDVEAPGRRLPPPSLPGAEVEEIEVVYRGRCPTCAAATSML